MQKNLLKIEKARLANLKLSIEQKQAELELLCQKPDAIEIIAAGILRKNFDKLPTTKVGGFRYQQPMLPMKAKTNKVSYAGRCPNLCSYELFLFGLSVLTLECRHYS